MKASQIYSVARSTTYFVPFRGQEEEIFFSLYPISIIPIITYLFRQFPSFSSFGLTPPPLNIFFIIIFFTFCLSAIFFCYSIFFFLFKNCSDDVKTASTLLKVVVIVAKHYHLPKDNHGLTSEWDIRVSCFAGIQLCVRFFSAYSVILIDEILRFLQSCKSYTKIISKLLFAPVDFLKNYLTQNQINTIITSNK